MVQNEFDPLVFFNKNLSKTFKYYNCITLTGKR